MKRRPLKSKEVNKLLESYKIKLNKKDLVELIENEFKIILINKEPQFFYYKDKLIPTLQYLQNNPILKKITVDKGAIKFIINGADIMRPGITKIEEEIKENEYVLIIDENHQKPLAVGISLLNSKDLQNQSTGKVIKNIHFIGDKIWKNDY